MQIVWDEQRTFLENSLIAIDDNDHARTPLSSIYKLEVWIKKSNGLLFRRGEISIEDGYVELYEGTTCLHLPQPPQVEIDALTAELKLNLEDGHAIQLRVRSRHTLLLLAQALKATPEQLQAIRDAIDAQVQQ